MIYYKLKCLKTKCQLPEQVTAVVPLRLPLLPRPGGVPRPEPGDAARGAAGEGRAVLPRPGRKHQEGTHLQGDHLLLRARHQQGILNINLIHDQIDY